MTRNSAYDLAKNVWTESDVEIMGWHDALIYGMVFLSENEHSQGEILFDIDYIFQWIDPVPPLEYFTFQVAPCTLVFKNVSELTITIDTSGLWPIELQIDHVSKEIMQDQSISFWTIKTQQGVIKFKATGFTQYIRKYPKHVSSQQLTLIERGGISFDKTSCKI